jgi:flagellar motor switch protein FliN/FliY
MLTVEGRPFFRGKIKDGNIKILEHPLYYEVEESMNKNEPDEHEEDLEEEIGEVEELEEEGIEEEEEDIEEEVEEEKPVVSEAKVPVQQQEVKTSSLDDIPLSIVVEAGRLQMSVQSILELQPGNILELNVHPERGVDLVVNGNCIGKGELLKIGDVLGVRVLEVG